MKIFNPKRPAEAVTLTFDFTAELPLAVTITSVNSVTVEILRGVDASGISRLSGAAVIAGNEVRQRFIGGELGVDYIVTPQVTLSDSQIRELPGVVQVRRET